MWFRRRSDDWWVVDTTNLDRDQQIEACRSALGVIGPEARRLQCDVPWDRHEDWPEDVIEAARELVSVHSGYRTTGWVDNFSPRVWRAFMTFAPYCYSSDVWTSDGAFLAEVNDEGSSLTIRLLPEQAHALEQSTYGAPVVPVKRWRRSGQRRA